MDWVQFLSDNQIPWVTHGPNTKKGEVSVRCPWCGEDDPSEHLGINLTSPAWGCHRNGAHRGKNPIRLIMGLLGCSLSHAKLILGQYDQADPETLDDVLAMLADEERPKPTIVERLTMLPEFRPIKPEGLTKKFYSYLQDRGFDDPYQLSIIYNLRCCLTGKWQDRIIIPMYKDGKLWAWTGRALINPVHAPRYLTTSGGAIKQTVFNEDNLTGADILFITEGPFDALKLDYYGFDLNAHATCVFGTSITNEQMFILRDASSRYKKTVLLLDADAVEPAFAASDWLPRAEICMLPDGVKDPGDLSKQQVYDLIRSLHPS